VRARQAAADRVAKTIDALKENYYLRARVDEAREARALADAEAARSLEDLRRKNDELRGQLERLLAR